MKNYLLSFCLSFLFLNAFPHDKKFEEAMQRNIALLYAPAKTDDLQTAINNLERIASVEKTRWEPSYYIAFGRILQALRESNATRKDDLLESARTAADLAAGLKPNDSEIIALQGFVVMLKITVDPSRRGPLYSGAALQSFQKALAINPQNPRAIVLNAQMQFGMAKFFGQASSSACDDARKGVDLLQHQNSAEALAPTWGLLVANDLLAQCK